MNTLDTSTAHANTAVDRFALRVTARLTSGTAELPYDISERLRASRMQALAKRKKAAAHAHVAAPVIIRNGGSAVLGRGGEGGRSGGWWNAMISAVPLLALVAGLVMINMAQDESSTNDVAEVDAALLTDDLPPAAYSDPGFVQFLKTSAQKN